MFRSIISRSYSTTISKPLIGSHALITGGSQGVGFEIASLLASKGCRITIAARNEKKLAASAELLNENNPLEDDLKHDYLSIDLKELPKITENMKTYSDMVKDVNILVNCAGKSQNSLLMTAKDHDIIDVINTNLTSAIILTKYISRLMLRNKNPIKHIVNISSVIGVRPMVGTTSYAASKAGLVGFTKATAVELGRKGIRCNAVLPGLISDTAIGDAVNKEIYNEGMAILQGVPNLSTKDIANTVLYLIANGQVTGEALVVDKGYLLH